MAKKKKVVKEVIKVGVDLFGEDLNRDVLLRDRFIEPPFSVLDTKTGNWKGRVNQWKAKGIKSELGRGENVLYANEEIQRYDFYRDKEKEDKPLSFAESEALIIKGKRAAECINTAHMGEAYGIDRPQSGTSIFDPALTELMYSWFCPAKGSILDVFSGGSVRGIVACYLLYKYTGIDLRKEQIESNRLQAIEILPADNQPDWRIGDSNKVLDDMQDNPFEIPEYDMLFTCPPYLDLEIYSEDPADLSNMEYEEFVPVYKSIIKKSCMMLKNNRFAVIVVGDVRDKEGNYRDFIGLTKEAYKEAGLKLYNEIILLNVVGTAAIRANNAMKNRKMVKIHQNILVFIKGNIKHFNWL